MRMSGTLVAGLLIAGSFAVGTAFSQDAGGGSGDPAPAPAPAKEKDGFKGADPREHSAADMQRRMMESVMPNRFHKKLERLLGEWDVDLRMWMAPDAAPMASKGTSKWTWLYEGKWVQGNSEMSMMGMGFKSQWTMGYDNFKKKYVASGVNSMETALRTSEGNFGKDDNVLYTYGFVDEYTTGEHDKTAAIVFRFEGADRFTIEIHDLSIGIENAKVMEMVHTRRK
jgi:hypothetical protein